MERKDPLEIHLAQKGSCLLCAYSQLGNNNADASWNIHHLTPLRFLLTSMYIVNMTQMQSNIFIWEIMESCRN